MELPPVSPSILNYRHYHRRHRNDHIAPFHHTTSIFPPSHVLIFFPSWPNPIFQPSRLSAVHIYYYFPQRCQFNPHKIQQDVICDRNGRVFLSEFVMRLADIRCETRISIKIFNVERFWENYMRIEQRKCLSDLAECRQVDKYCYKGDPISVIEVTKVNLQLERQLIFQPMKLFTSAIFSAFLFLN